MDDLISRQAAIDAVVSAMIDGADAELVEGVMELLADNVETAIKNVESLCREHFKPTKKELEIIGDHIIQADSLKVLRMINAENLNNRGRPGVAGCCDPDWR